QLQDVLDMQNHMRETLDKGLGELQFRQGQGGLPAMPADARALPVDAPFASAAPPPDPNVAAGLNQEAQQADQAKRVVISDAWAGGSGAAPDGAQNPGDPSGPPTISLGQSIDDVTAILGKPKQVVNLGEKRIYVYPDIKIYFTGGKVSDVQ